MKPSLHLQKRMLEVETLNYKRQLCAFIALISSTCIFMLLTAAQCGLLTWLGKNKTNFWITIDFIAVMTALLSFVCGLVFIFLVERERKKIQKKLEAESLFFGFSLGLEEEKKEFSEKCSAFCEDFSQKMDLFGSSCNFTLQLVSLIFLLAHGIAISEMYKFGHSRLPLIQILDLGINSSFFLAALLLTMAHLISTKLSKSQSKNSGKISRIIAIMFTGSSLIFSGKIICVLESVGACMPVYLENGGTLPIGWLTRTVGIILLSFSFLLVLKQTSARCDALVKSVQGGEAGREVLSMVTTQDVRSCFGYMECGTR